MNRPQSGKMHAGPGFRIRTETTRWPDDFVAQFRAFDVPDVSDVLNGLYALDHSISLLTSADHKLCGTACTVRVFPGDNLMVHKSLDIARPGDIVVVDAGGDRSANAVLGDRICAKAKHKGIAGFIVDGLVRDLSGIVRLGIPVFARATTTMGPSHRGPGEINYPVSCGGKVVSPGDILIADQSGAVVVPYENGEDVLSRAKQRQADEAAYLADLEAGEFSNAWVDAELEQGNCLLDERPLGSARDDPTGS